MKKRIVLIFLLLGILFPFAAMARGNGGYATVFNRVFDSLAAHILMHAALFAALSWLAMSFVPKKTPGQKILISLACVLVVALAQETIQAVSVTYFGWQGILADLGVDLGAGIIPPLINLLIQRKKRPLVSPTDI